MAPDAPHRRPGRPVADAPIDRLLTHTEDVARSWMFELLSGVELHEAPDLVTEPFTRDGPRVCDAALRALADESDLRRLERDGALWPLAARVGEMTGSRAPQRVLVAVDALHDVLWRELRGELRGVADPDLVADLAARLNRVCALIRDAGLTGAGGAPGLEPARRRGFPGGEGRHEGERRIERWGAGPGSVARGVTEPEEVAGEPVAEAEAPGEGAEPAPRQSAVAEEWSVGPEGWAASEKRPVSGEPASAGEALASGEPSALGESSALGKSSALGESPSAPSGPTPRATPLWVGALTDEIEAAKASFVPLSLLLAELEDAERIAESAGPQRAGEAFSEFALAVRRALRRQDILVQETPSRAWVIARDTARAGAHALGTRIAESVGESSSLSGSPLVSSVGVAVLGEDGVDCAELMEAAEEARFAASARGIEVSRRMR